MSHQDALRHMLGQIQFHMLASAENVALVTWSETVTFGSLGARVQGIIDAFSPASPACQLITGHKEPDAVAAMLACAFTGRPFVFADRSNPLERTMRIAAVAEAKAGLAAGPLPGVTDISLLDLSLVQGRPLRQDSLAETDGDGVFNVIFTSGSTGEPKGLPVSRRNFAIFGKWYGEILAQASRGGAHVNHASLGFDMGMLDLWPTLALGRPVIMLDHRNNVVPRNNIRHLSACEAAAPATWFSTPSMLKIMCADPLFCQERFPRLASFFAGGEALQRSLVRELMRRFPDATVRNGYGPSEVTCLTNVYLLSAGDIKGDGPISLGRTIAPSTARIVDENGLDTPIGQIGEIVLGGPQVVGRYLPARHPANTAFGSHLGQPTYRTGDLGRLDEHGCLTVLGRVDRQVKWNGNRIELDEVEDAAAAIAEVQNAACLPVKEAGAVASIVLFVQPRDGARISRAEVLDAMALALPSTMLPRDIRFVNSLPMTVNGKLDRVALMKGPSGRVLTEIAV